MFNKLIVALMPLAPRALVKMISKRYISGEDAHSAIKTCEVLKKQGFLTTIDILGESITTESQANEGREAYLHLLADMSGKDIEQNVSLKPTALGLGISSELAFENISMIVAKANESGVFIRIDMEDSPYTTKTIQIYERLRKDYPDLGTVLQAYMRRSMVDARSIAAGNGNLRICKGIYREPAAIAFQEKEEIRDNFLALVREMLSHGAYVGIATHDTYLIDEALKIIAELGISPDKYEFQALMGVPILKRLQQLVQSGHKVRIYVPFGKEWYAYSSRRLKENPDIAGYILKNMVLRN
ncbi:proline dehydrogenase family protein [bacterium]|nr:proline dehydrogenase family protein [bacterium]